MISIASSLAWTLVSNGPEADQDDLVGVPVLIAVTLSNRPGARLRSRTRNCGWANWRSPMTTVDDFVKLPSVRAGNQLQGTVSRIPQ